MIRHILLAFAMTALIPAIATRTDGSPVPLRSGPDARRIAEAWVREQGWPNGRTPGGLPVIITSARVAGTAGDPTYPTAVRAAFDRASNDARQEAANYVGARVRAEIRQVDKVIEVIGDPQLAKALCGTATGEAFSEEGRLKSLTEVAAAVAMTGFTTLQTAVATDEEGHVEIAVVSAISPRTLVALGGGRIDGDVASAPLAEWFARIPDDVLARTEGIRMKCDERGLRAPVCFERVFSDDQPLIMDGRLASAQTAAKGRLARLAAESVACRALEMRLAERKEGQGMPEQFRNGLDFERMITTNVDAAIDGVEMVGRRKVRDPDSGRDMVVIAMSLASGTGATPGAKPPCAGGCPPIPDANIAARARQVCASGTGPSRSAAIKSALLDAVSRGGARVDGTEVQQRQYDEAVRKYGEQVESLLKASISSEQSITVLASGFVHSFDVLEEREVMAGTTEVSICANLLRFDPKDPRFGAPPTIAVAIDPTSRGRIAGTANTDATDKAVRLVARTVEQVLAGSEKYVLIDEGNTPALRRYREDVLDRVRRGESPPLEAAKLGQQLSADLILVVRIEAEFSGGNNPFPKILAGDTAAATVDAKLLNVATSQVPWFSPPISVRMAGRELLEARAGKDPALPDAKNLPPLEIVCNRVCGDLVRAMRENGRFVEPRRSGALRVERVFRDTVTLSGGDGSIRAGAKLRVINAIPVTLPGGRTVIDRDEVAELLVIAVDADLIKAKVVRGDPELIDPQKSEVDVAGGP
jgi:hypothetical protein